MADANGNSWDTFMMGYNMVSNGDIVQWLMGYNGVIMGYNG
jgi:hypothetical protein